MVACRLVRCHGRVYPHITRLRPLSFALYRSSSARVLALVKSSGLAYSVDVDQRLVGDRRLFSVSVDGHADRSGDLRLVCTARRVLRPLTIAGLVPLFNVKESLDEALADS